MIWLRRLFLRGGCERCHHTYVEHHGLRSNMSCRRCRGCHWFVPPGTPKGEPVWKARPRKINKQAQMEAAQRIVERESGWHSP